MVDLEDIKGVKKPVTFACVGKHILPNFMILYLSLYLHQQKTTRSFRMRSAKRERSSSRIASWNMSSSCTRVCLMVSPIDSSIQLEFNSTTGFGVYGSYPDPLIKDAQEGVFEQFVQFLSRH